MGEQEHVVKTQSTSITCLSSRERERERGRDVNTSGETSDKH